MPDWTVVPTETTFHSSVPSSGKSQNETQGGPTEQRCNNRCGGQHGGPTEDHNLLLLKCCFTSTETVGLLGTGTQTVHLDFHTAPELCTHLMMMKCCFTSTETVGLLGTGAQDGHLDYHTAPEL